MLTPKFWTFVGKLSFSKWGYKKLRESLLFLKLIKHSGRQEFHLGSVSDKESFLNFLLNQKFEKSNYSWIDDDEYISLRKIDNYLYQYHLRIYSDGEVKGHYEYAPDRHPLKHYFKRRFEPREDYFQELLKPFLK
jgi:hypothetical protein